MAGFARSVGMALLLAVVAIGCRTAQPDLKPAPQPEVLTIPPPQEARFGKSEYPAQAFRGLQGQHRLPADSLGGNLMSNPITPASDSTYAPSMSGGRP